jgi:hypothetical protein
VRTKRVQETTITSPPKPPSPDDDSDDEDERLFWFKYVEDIMLKEHQREVDLRDNVSEDDLGMNKKQRSQASKQEIRL